MSVPQTVGEIVDRLPAPVPVAAEPGSAALMKLIERAAMSADFDVAKLEKLLDVKERWEANEARKAFVVALSAFKADPPTVVKNKHAGFESKRTGDKTDYDYLTLDKACDAIGPALSRQGLSHRWDVQQSEGMIRVTCILTHALGHSERVMLQAGADQSGSKNSIQAIGSTVTYLQRYTLLAATGLAAAGQDNDAHAVSNGGNGHPAGETFITAEQKEELIALMRETGASTRKFLELYHVAAIDELPIKLFAEAKAVLEQRKAKISP